LRFVCLTKRLCPASAAKTDVGVGVRRRVVQIERENPIIRAIVPIATAFESFLCYPYFKN